MAAFARVSRDYIYNSTTPHDVRECQPSSAAPPKGKESVQKPRFSRRSRQGKWVPLHLADSAIDVTENNSGWDNSKWTEGVSLTSTAPLLANSPNPGKSKFPNAKVGRPTHNNSDGYPHPTTGSNNANSPRPKKRRSRRTSRKKNMPADSDPVSARAYIPPHLRKSASPEASQTKVLDQNSTKPAPAESDTVKPAQVEQISEKPIQMKPNAVKPTVDGASGANGATKSLKPKHARQKQSPVVPAEVDSPGMINGFAAPSQETFVWPPTKSPDNNPASARRHNDYNWTDEQYKQPLRVPRNPRAVWTKNRDLKPLPIDQQSDGGVKCESESEGDPHYDIKKLVDFNGDWLPAPVDWDDRKAYHDRHFFDHIMNWMNRCKEVTGWMDVVHCVPRMPDSEPNVREGILQDIFNTSPYHAKINGDLVPTSWMPVQIEGMAPRNFWTSHPARAPAPLSDIDLNETRPWWESYNTKTGLIEPIAAPNAVLDFEDANNRLPQVQLGSSQTSIENKHRALEKKRMKQYITDNEAPRLTREPSIEISGPDRSIKPKINIYLRPVIPTDVAQITNIYNYYVLNTIHANEFNARTVRQISERMNAVIAGDLPWIVAVHRGGGGNRASNQLYVNEKIVGFASLDDYCDQGSMYRFTFEMEIYVHYEFRNLGVGSCLMDRMLELCDPNWNARGGYDWITRCDYLKFGAPRIIKLINLTVPHDHGDKKELNDIERLTNWLKPFRYRVAGQMFEVGHKYGKVVDVRTFSHKTGEVINPDLRPQNPL